MARRLAAALLWVALLAGPDLAQEATPGAIRGTVLDREVDSPLVGVRVVILGTVLETRTGEDGIFLFSRVPAGSYTLAFTKEGYERQVVSSVVVVAGKLADVRASLGIEVVEMEELVVTGGDLALGEEGGLLDIRAESVAFQDAISADLITKAGASDVAGALKLVVGASITEGKYATVRGLSDRYTGTTLNGVRVPSADPRRRAVQVDLFPTGTLENLSVTKTFTPDLQGEFTGGGVDIQTRSIPEKLTYAVSVGAEDNSLATGNEAFLTYEGGGTPLLGGGAADRALPDVAKEAYTTLPTIPSFRAPYTPQKIAASQAYDELVRSFEPAMGVTTETPGLNGNFSFVGGNRWERPSGRVLGLLGALTLNHKYDFYDNAQNNNGTVSVADQPMGLSTRTESKGTEETLTGFLVNFEMLAGQNHRYALNLIGNQSAEDEARFQYQNLGGGTQQQNQALHYTERFVGSAQIHGDHHFGESQQQTLDWFVAYNTTSQEEPDVRFFRNDFNTETLEARKPRDSTDPQNTRRIWRDVDESNWQTATNFALPFSAWGDLPSTMRVGVRLDRTDRDYTQRSFSYTFPNQTQGGTNQAALDNQKLGSFHASSADQLWTDVFTDANRIGLATNHPPAPNQLLWVIQPLPSSDVNYTGEQDIDALFAMVEFPFLSNLKAIAGVRAESTDLSVIPTNERSGKVEIIEVFPSGDRGVSKVDQEVAVADIQDVSLLPSAGLVYSIRQGMSLRATMSGTIARPNFRELAPVATEEFIFGDEYVGNPDLVLSKITNYDLRWEWFPREGAVLAASAFYKQIRNPIELISFSAGGRNFIQPVNYERGKLSGLELEARSSLSWAAESLRDLSVGVNLTLIVSEVEVPASDQKSLATFGLDQPTRRLQGQPDKIWNANLTYDSERFGTSAGVFYNVTGEMLLTGAATTLDGGVPNVFQEQFKSLDVTVGQRIGKGFSMTVKGKNLLANETRTVYRTPAGEETIKTERETARLLGITFAWKW